MQFREGDKVVFVGRFSEWGIYPEDHEQARQLAEGMVVENVVPTPLDEQPDHQAVFCHGFSAMFSSQCLRKVSR